MRDIDELSIPDDRRYSDDHEWALPAQDRVRVGISDFAQNQLGDIVYVELPGIGATFGYNESFGTVESVKAVSDLLMPVAGEVIAVNPALAGSPQLVNERPYDEGWMVEVKPDDPGDTDRLMNAADYKKMLKGLD
ncbi:glycine cleavage system protein GcvH [bacterium]|nr:glycine cleavage system protein GcvH [bacterium]